MKLVGWSKNIAEDYRKKSLNNGKTDFLPKKYLGIGCIERGEGGQAIVELVPNRKRKTLFKLIKKWIKPKTLIISDEWPVYLQLEKHLPQYKFILKFLIFY